MIAPSGASARPALLSKTPMTYQHPEHSVASADPRGERLRLYWMLIRGDRPIGWLLLLWPTWWGLWLAAEGAPPPWILLVFSAGVWLTRSAGCVVNDYADRWLDGQVERTRHRPLATGAVRGREALALFAILMLVAFALVFTLNRLTVLMSFVGIALAMSYPYLKRYTYLPQVYLGLAFGWGIPMAFAAIRGEVPPIAWVLYTANILWATAYDTWYAMVDRDDDIAAGERCPRSLSRTRDQGGQVGAGLDFRQPGDAEHLQPGHYLPAGAASALSRKSSTTRAARCGLCCQKLWLSPSSISSRARGTCSLSVRAFSGGTRRSTVPWAMSTGQP